MLHALQRHMLVRSLLMLALASTAFAAQQAPPPQPATPAPAAAPIERRDPALDAAANEVGRALVLRCFCASDELSFDAQGHLPPSARPRTVDWTLAGMNVQKVTRKGPSSIELDGVRVAIRFAADRHEFERRPQKDEAMRVTVADTGDPATFERALNAVFALGIDRPLQRSMPDYWQHYFEPGLAWPAALPELPTGQTIYNPGSQVPAAGAEPAGSVSPAVLTHKADATYTAFAARDHIRGIVRLRMVVDTQGSPHRISVVLPLGYGMDEEAATAAAKMRFSPATLNGRPVPSNVFVEQDFVLAPQPTVR